MQQMKFRIRRDRQEPRIDGQPWPDNNVWWVNSPADLIGRAGRFSPDIKEATIFNEDQKKAYVAASGEVPVGLKFVLVPTRFTDALAITSGAGNLIAIAGSLRHACRECMEQGLGTSQTWEDPAVRLISHQIAALTAQHAIVTTTDYLDLLRACEAGK